MKFTRRATGHVVTLIETGMYLLIICISGHIWRIEEKGKE